MAVAYGFGVADEIEIRPVRPSEHKAAGEATARAYREFVSSAGPRFAEYLDRIADIGGRADHTTVLMAAVDGEIAGSATLELDSRLSSSAEPLAHDEAHLRMLGVSPQYRGRGIARLLVDACIETAREHGKRRLTLDTTPLMIAAQHLYSSMGFVADGERLTPDGTVLLGYTLDIESRVRASR